MSNVVTLPTNNTVLTAKDMMAESKFFMGYSRWMDDAQRYETWEESVNRVIDMHHEKYASVMSPELSGLINFARNEYIDQSVLGAHQTARHAGHPVRTGQCIRFGQS